MQRRAIGPDRFVLLGLVPLVLMFLAILYSDRLPKVPLWLVGVGWILVAALVIFAVIKAMGRRTKALRRVAGELGLEFAEAGDEKSLRSVFEPRTAESDERTFQAIMSEIGPQPDAVVKSLSSRFAKAMEKRTLQQSELRHLTLFRETEHPTASNVMGGNLGEGEVLVFDYSYRESGIDRDASATQTVACFRFRGRKFPSFQISPQTLLGRISAAIGFQELDFDSKRFRFRGDDPNAIRSFFDPGKIRFIESLSAEFDETVEGAGECVVVYQFQHIVPPDQIATFVKQASAVASSIGKA
jgi:hypothetical protein